MIHAGLVSVTFRPLAPAQIIAAAVDAGLDGIEWGGDVHVPAGNVGVARDIARQTRDAGLRVSAYGSYYRLGASPAGADAAVLESAVALGAPLVRVWAGTAGSNAATPDERRRVVDDARRFCELARSAGVRVATEWHGGTLTDDAASARMLFDAIDHPNLYTYWQPHQRTRPAACLVDLETALPRLAGVHVFQWHVETGERQALADGAPHWPAYLTRIANAGDLFASLEFVRDDSVEQMKQDAVVLREWLAAFS